MNPSFREILKVLSKHEVEYIVVGGVAAVIHGGLSQRSISMLWSDLVKQTPSELSMRWKSLMHDIANIRQRFDRPKKM